MIAMKSSGDHAWSWAGESDERSAEADFKRIHPGLHAHFKLFETQLRKRQDRGTYWWELRSCAYWSAFDKPKVMYQDITWRPQFCLDCAGRLCNNTVYFLSTEDPWILAVLNSPLAWWYSWRRAVHGKDEALRYFTAFVEGFPIPDPPAGTRPAADELVVRLADLTRSRQETVQTLLDWLSVEYDVEKPTLRLQAAVGLDSESLIAEVRKIRGKKNPLSAAGLKNLRAEHANTIEPARQAAHEAEVLERRLSDLVNEAYGLTPEEVSLMWKTAPPRMPISSPPALGTLTETS